MLWRMVTLGVVMLCQAACQKTKQQPIVPSNIAPGTVTVDISIPRTAEDRYWQYQIVPTAGSVIEVKNGTRERTSTQNVAASAPRPDCYRGTTVLSPDRRLVAACSGEFGGRRANFSITVNQTQQVFEWNPDGWRGIDGVLWSSGSRSLALLNHSEQRGGGILERIWAAAGHPVPHSTYYLDIVDVTTGKVYELSLQENVSSGEARTLEWSGE